VATIAPAKSAFITALAWVFIVLGGFATLISVLQNIMIAVLMPMDEMAKVAEQARNDEHMPWFAAMMFQHMRLFFLAFLVVCSTTLAGAIGLLLRKNWARILFIALMALGILWNVAAMVFTVVFVTSLPVPPGSPAGFADQFETMSRIMMAFNIVLAIAFTALFGWILKRLMSDDIRREFSASVSADHQPA
jgi:hypothetical protein